LEASIALNTTSPNEVLEYNRIHKERNNIYLLDVNVRNKITGIDVAAMIRSQEAGAYIVFISAHPEYVMLSLKARIFDYLIKPVSIETLETCISAIMRDYAQLSNKNTIPTLSVKSGFEIYSIPQDEIVYFEKYGHVLVIHTVTDRIEGTESLENMELKLDKDKFFRCHKSYLINLDFISHIDYPNNLIFLKNGENCSVSKRNKKELKQICSRR
jgi:two-component system response regulator AgrA